MTGLLVGQGSTVTGVSYHPRADAVLDAVEAAWWAAGDLGVTVRRIVAHGPTITSQSIYTYFGSLDLAVTAATDRAIDDLDHLGTALTPAEWHQYARRHPARWLMAASGRGPTGPTTGLDRSIERLRHLLGGPIQFAMINGIIAAVFHDQLDPADASTALAAAVRYPIHP